jgi:hypothetical protein
MGLLNAKCVLLVVLLIIAAWSFPMGVLVDAGIVTGWMLIRRKKKDPKQAVAAGGDPSLSDAIKALTLMVAGDKLANLGKQANPEQAVKGDRYQGQRGASIRRNHRRAHR